MAVKDFGIALDFSNGISIDIDNLNNQLSLIKMDETYDGVYSIYENEGTWTSEIIDLVDKYTELGNLAINSTVYTNQSYKAYTRTSNDSYSWDDYIEIDYTTGKMQSIPKRFIQVKIELMSDKVEYEEVALDYNNNDEVLSNSEFMTTQNGILELRKDFNYPMELIEGTTNIYKTTILSDYFKGINKIRLILDGEEV